MSNEWRQREREYCDAVLCKLPSCSRRLNRFGAEIPKGFTLFTILISTHHAVVTSALAARSRLCVQAVPHNAHVEGRSLLLHCLGTPGPSIAQPAFRDQIMTSTDMNGLLFRTEINSRSLCGNLVHVRKFTAFRISFEFLSFSYVKLMALFPCYCGPE